MVIGNRKISILQGEGKWCYITGAEVNLEKHHIYFGSGKRDISDRHGFWVWLKKELHTGTKESVHGDPQQKLNYRLKRVCQREFEKTHTRADFMKIIGRNYLDDDEEKENGNDEDGFRILSEVPLS